MSVQIKRAPAPDPVAFLFTAEIEHFSMLAAELDRVFGQGWMPVNPDLGMQSFVDAPLDVLEYAIVTASRDDEFDLAPIADVISNAHALGLKVLLIADDLSPTSLHRLLRAGADDFAPYPLPEGTLAESLDRLQNAAKTTAQSPERTQPRRGELLAVYGAAGGVGATSFAVNLACELADALTASDMRVCLLDLDFQYGSVATYLDLPRQEAIYDLLSTPDGIDRERLAEILTSYRDHMAVLSAPLDALPLDIIGPEEMDQLLAAACSAYDFVVVDLPSALVSWSDRILTSSHRFFTLFEADMRSAQNMQRLLRTLKAEQLPMESLSFILNRAPGRFDSSGRGRVQRIAESLAITVDAALPEGGRAVKEASDAGKALMDTAPRNPLRREIQRIAQDLAAQAARDKALVG